jgi:hypothetical protein
MAWWSTQLIFHNDTLVSEGIDPLWLDEFEVVTNGEERPAVAEQYTKVIVSGYALYGQLRGYYALGVAHWQLDRENGRIFVSEAGETNTEPVTSLTPAQRQIIRECLKNINPDAWEASAYTFRRQLEFN